MQKLAAKLTEKLLRRRLISPEQSEWCAYLVECKLEQLLCFSVLITLGCLIAPLWKVLLLNWNARIGFTRTTCAARQTGYTCIRSWAVCFPRCAVNWPHFGRAKKRRLRLPRCCLFFHCLCFALLHRSMISTFISTAMKCRHCVPVCKNAWLCMPSSPAWRFLCSRRHLASFLRLLVSLPYVCFLHGWGLE